MARDLVKYLVAHDVLMRPGHVPLAKALTTNIVGNIEEVQLVVRSRLLVNATHPSAAGKRVGMEVQHNRCPPTQQSNKMRSHRFTQPARASTEVSDSVDLSGV